MPEKLGLYNPEVIFAGRDAQVESIKYRLKNLHLGTGNFQSVVNFVGLHGMGKTALLNNISQAVSSNAWEADGVPQTLTTRIDIADYTHGFADGPRVLLHMMEQVKKQHGEKVDDSEFRQKYLAFVDHQVPDQDADAATWDTYRDSARQVAQGFFNCFSSQIQGPLLFLLDNCETRGSDRHPQVELFQFLEHDVIEPLSNSGRSLIVAASRMPLAVTSFQIRRHMFESDLSVPTNEIIASQFSPEKADLTSAISHLTANYPPAVQYIVAQIKLRGITQAQELDTQRDELVQGMIENIVQPVLLSGVDEGMQEAARLISRIGLFDVLGLNQILTGVDPDIAKKLGIRNFLYLLSNMCQEGIAHYNSLTGTYSLDPTVRHFTQMQLEGQDGLLETIDRLAIQMYDRLIEQAEREGQKEGISAGRLQELIERFNLERSIHQQAIDNRAQSTH